MSRYIDADELIRFYEPYADMKVPVNALLEQIKDTSTADVVKVVRCKDCMYNDRGWCGSIEYGTRHIEDNDYCSYGEEQDI